MGDHCARCTIRSRRPVGLLLLLLLWHGSHRTSSLPPLPVQSPGLQPAGSPALSLSLRGSSGCSSGGGGGVLSTLAPRDGITRRACVSASLVTAAAASTLTRDIVSIRDDNVSVSHASCSIPRARGAVLRCPAHTITATVIRTHFPRVRIR